MPGRPKVADVVIETPRGYDCLGHALLSRRAFVFEAHLLVR